MMHNLPKTLSWLNRRWPLPAVLALLFLLILFWLPWQARRLEGRERQEQLIAETLWVEQALVLQFGRNEEALRQIGQESVRLHLPADTVQRRLRHWLASHAEIDHIDWFDAHGKILTSTRTNPAPPSAAQLAWQEQNGRDGNTRCRLPSSETSGLLTCHLPLPPGQSGSLVLAYRLGTLLEKHVPWWFAQDNQISLLDADDQLLATRTAAGEGQHVYVHQRTLELPGLVLGLRTDSAKSLPKLWSALLSLALGVLSLGLLWSLLALWRDIKRRLAAEVSFRAAMENSVLTGLHACDLAGVVTFVNPAFCQMVGLSAEQLLGKSAPMPYWPTDLLAAHGARFTAMLAGQVSGAGVELLYQRADGSRFPALVHDAPLVDENGRHTGYMSSILDISELRRTQELARVQQEKLETAARLATIGEIGSTLAHELNQPLAAISSYATGAINLLEAGQTRAELGPPAVPAAVPPAAADASTSHTPALISAMEKVRQQAARAGQVIKSVHALVKKRVASRSMVAVPELIIGLMPLIELRAKPNQVQIKTRIAPNLPPVAADPVLLEQVLLNLTRNAIEAMADSPPARRVLQLVVALAPEPVAELRVQVIDQGSGLPDEVAEKLFTPFFSTKETGMGMGLNLCRSALEFHGGRLWHEPNPGGGTIFGFTLPLGRVG
jgi:two-component system sensor histidine kinase DctS